jgi:nitrogen fixation NifU-like protein
MSDVRELYQSVILDHNKRPRNFRKVERANRRAEGYNPLCGDKVTVQLRVEDGVVRDVGFEGSGCAISTASASMMTESVKGRSLADAERLFRQFHDLLVCESRTAPSDDEQKALGKLTVFSGVREYPARVKCATLVWHALHSALEGSGDPVSTE